jgi:hypothetical protein
MPPRKPKKPHVHSWETKQRMTAAQKLRADFLELIRTGIRPVEAQRILGKSLSWYEATRAKHPDWAREITNTRLALQDAALPGMDFVNFRKIYFNNYTAPHHYRMIEAFELAKPGSMTVVLAYPGSGKTTTLTDKYCHILAENPNSRICVISEGQGLSRAIIGQVSDRMSDEERFKPYHLRYGPFRVQAWKDNEAQERDPIKRAWTADYFKILAAEADQKDPSLASYGATSRIYGARFDWMIYDDIQSNETLGNTDKYLRSMRTSWMSRTNLGDAQRGKSLMIGSRVGAGDIYEAMDDHQMIDTLITIPALTVNIPPEEHYTIIKGKVVANPNCSAQPTWAAQTLQDLAEIRKFAGEEVWARTYMQDALAETSAVFTEAMIEQAKDHTRIVGPQAVGVDTWAALDPALDSGICAYLTCALSSDKLYLLDSMGRTDTHSYTDIYDWVNNWSAKYRPSRWIVEENNFQKGMQQDDRLHAIGKRHRFDIEAHRTGRNKNDTIMGIRMMANAFADGEISIPWGDEHSREVMAPLIHELRTWKPNTRGSALRMDRVVTLWFIWMRWQAEREALSATIPLLPRPSWVLRSVG